MVHHRKSEQGNVIELVIIGVLVLAVIGLVVWRFVGTSNDSRLSQQNQTITTPSTATDKEESTTAEVLENSSTSSNANEGYIVLDDWGVRFKPVDNSVIKYYKDSTIENLYMFTTATVLALDGCDGAGDTSGLLGSVQRSKVKFDLENMSSPPSAMNNGNKIGDYYYYYGHPQALCSKTDKDNKIEVAQVNMMRTFLGTIEAKQ